MSLVVYETEEAVNKMIEHEDVFCWCPACGEYVYYDEYVDELIERGEVNLRCLECDQSFYVELQK